MPTAPPTIHRARGYQRRARRAADLAPGAGGAPRLRPATLAGPFPAATDYTFEVTDLTEGAVARRVPALTDERLRVLSRRQPVTVAPGTTLAACVRAIQRSGTGDSVFVCERRRAPASGS